MSTSSPTISRRYVKPERPQAALRLPRAMTVGVVASIILMLASFSGGATRNRGGFLEYLNIGFFSYGHGRNLGMLMFWVGLFGLVAAWVLLGRQTIAPHLRATQGPLGSDEPDGASATVSTVVKHMVAWVAPLALAAPVASRDVYSYLMQGAMVRDGFDPYTEGAAANPGPFLLEVSHDWRNTTTPYGPLHLWMGEGVTTLVGSNVSAGIILYKAISIVGFAVIGWAVIKIAKELGGNAALALWLGVANPVMILHLVAGMHNESVMVALVSVGLWLALRNRFIAGIALIAVAVALKATAFIAMPFVFWLMMHRFAPRGSGLGRKVLTFALSGVVIVAETIAVVGLITWASGSSWGWLSEITGNSKVINPLAGPTLLTDIFAPLFGIFSEDITYNQILALMRTMSMVLMLLGLATVWLLFRKTRRAAILGTAAAYQVAFIFNSVTLPWYYASVISLVGTARPPMWLVKLATGASIFVALSFSGDGNHQLYNWWWVIALAFGSWAVVDWIFASPHHKDHPVNSPTAEAAN